jgi:hypothetical protein
MHGGGLISILAIPFELIGLAVSEALLKCAGLMYLFIVREGQRAEYFADALAE